MLMTVSNISERLTGTEARAFYDDVRCPACEGAKRPRTPFCPTCTSALTWQARAQLGAPVESTEFTEAYQRHLRHLQLNPRRRRRFMIGDQLPYRSIAEFEAAGWKFLGYGRCPATRCCASILFFRTPGNKRVRVGEDLQFHRVRCTDPEYFDRRRAAQTSAKARKKTS